MSLFNLVKAQRILVSFTLTNYTMSYRVVFCYKSTFLKRKRGESLGTLRGWSRVISLVDILCECVGLGASLEAHDIVWVIHCEISDLQHSSEFYPLPPHTVNIKLIFKCTEAQAAYQSHGVEDAFLEQKMIFTTLNDQQKATDTDRAGWGAGAAIAKSKFCTLSCSCNFPNTPDLLCTLLFWRQAISITMISVQYIK